MVRVKTRQTLPIWTCHALVSLTRSPSLRPRQQLCPGNNPRSETFIRGRWPSLLVTSRVPLKSFHAFPAILFLFSIYYKYFSPSRSVFFVRQHLSPLHLPLWQISFSTKKIFTPSLCWTLWKAFISLNCKHKSLQWLDICHSVMHLFSQAKRLRSNWQLCVQNVQLNLISLHTHGRSYRTCFSHRYKIQTVRDFLVYTVCWALHRNTLKHVWWNICICK